MPNRRKHQSHQDLDALDHDVSVTSPRDVAMDAATEPPMEEVSFVFHNITWTEEFSADAPSLANNEVIEGVFKFAVAPKPGNVEDLLGAGGAGDEAGTLKYGDITLRSLGRENSIEVLYATADEPDGFVFNKELDKSTPLLGIDDTPAESDPTYDSDDAGE